MAVRVGCCSGAGSLAVIKGLKFVLHAVAHIVCANVNVYVHSLGGRGNGHVVLLKRSHVAHQLLEACLVYVQFSIGSLSSNFCPRSNQKLHISHWVEASTCRIMVLRRRLSVGATCLATLKLVYSHSAPLK